MSLAVSLRYHVGEFSLSADFAVADGLSVLFGPSGAGKSLTLRIVAGLDRPAAGSVLLNGEALTHTARGIHVAPRDRRLGMVFQEALLLPHRSVLSNVALGVRASDRHERRRVANNWLERVGADELAHRKPAQLSGGQQQRVALARALAGDPRLLLLDEPFGALDLPVRRQLRALVRDLVDTAGVPALFVTHDHEEVAALADRVVLAEPGSIAHVVPPGEALAALDRQATGS